VAAEQANVETGSLRNAIRWGLLLAAIGTVGFRLPRLVSEFRQWRETLRLGDASGAERWHTVLTVDLVGALVVLAIGVGVFYVLRPRTRAAR
jgi:H+/Cl- antiporter ClcA